MRKLVGPLLFCLSSLSLFSAPVFHVNQPRLPDAMVGKVYAGGPLVVEGGGQCPRNQLWVRLVGGTLPAGMYLSAAGQFGGLPMEAGNYEFVVRVENGCGWSDQSMTLEVVGAPIMLANPAALEFRVIAGQLVAPAAIQVSSNRAGQPYTVETSAPWLRARPRAGRTPASGSALSADLVDVEIDTATLLPGQHRASIDIGGWRMGPVSVPVRVEVLSQSGAPSPGATQSMVEQPGQGNWSGPVAGLSDPRLPRISLSQPRESGAGPGVPPAAQPAKGPRKAAPAAAPAGRMSRSANLRSKYLSSKASAAAGSHAAPAAAPAPPAAEHSKPSPVGEPVKKADAHGKPADAHGKPAAKPAADAHGKPADAHAKPADAHGKPADAHGKPADAHAKPADAHAKPAADAHGKPKEAAKH